MLGKGPCVKSARMTQGPERARGEESLQEGGSLAGPEPEQGGEDDANSEADSKLPDGSVAGGGIGGGAEKGCEALVDAFAQGMREMSALEHDIVDKVD